jgi:hypothetical protein
LANSGRRKASARARGKTVQKSATTGRFVKAARGSGKTGRAVGSTAGTSRRNRTAQRAGTARRKTAAGRGSTKKATSGKRHLRLVAESERLERLVDQLGNNRVANLLSVSVSQPSRWRSGKEGIGPENQRKLIDLDYVFGRLEQLYTARQAEIWLTSYNGHLRARPVDVLRLRGAAPVIEAIDAEAQGAFA